MAKDKKVKEILLSVESTNSGGKGIVYEFDEDYVEDMNFDSVKRVLELAADVPGEKKVFVKITGQGNIVLCEPACAHMEISINNTVMESLDRLPELLENVFDTIERKQDQSLKKQNSKKGDSPEVK